MGVFVSVDVRNVDSSRLNLANLCGGFRGDFLGIDVASDRARRKSEQPIAKAGIAGKRGKLLRGKNRPAIDQNYMATDAEFWDRFGQLSRLFEGRTIGHEGGRSDNATDVSFNDGPVHARSESEVICVDDQAPHRASLAGEDNKKRGVRFVGASSSRMHAVELQTPALDFLPVSCQSY
jgi:hypothetical protein